MLIASRNSFAVKFPTTAKNYVQSGLVAMWDGIENAGWGKHDATATMWKDLVGGKDLSMRTEYAGFEGDCAYCNQKYTSGLPPFFSTWDAFGCKTLEVVVKAWDDTTYVPVYFGYGCHLIFFSVGGVKYAEFCSYNSSSQAIATDVCRGVFTAIYNASYLGTGNTIIAAYHNGTAGNPVGINTKWERQSKASLFSFYSYVGWGPSKGKINAIRMYSRALTADEIAANYAVDKIRFNLP